MHRNTDDWVCNLAPPPVLLNARLIVFLAFFTTLFFPLSFFSLIVNKV